VARCEVGCVLYRGRGRCGVPAQRLTPTLGISRVCATLNPTGDLSLRAWRRGGNQGSSSTSSDNYITECFLKFAVSMAKLCSATEHKVQISTSVCVRITTHLTPISITHNTKNHALG